MVYHRIFVIVSCAIQLPVLYSWTLLFIHPIYISLHLLIPNSQSIPPSPPLPSGNHKSVVYICQSISVL